MKVNIHKAVSFIVFAAFILLACAGLLVAARFGAVAGYIGFAWLVPLAGGLWWNYEFELFGISPLNAPFLYTLMGASFVLCVVCFPLLMVTHRGSMSAAAFAVLPFAAALHGIPFLFYLLLSRQRPG
jgi:hypothetical protein